MARTTNQLNVRISDEAWANLERIADGRPYRQVIERLLQSAAAEDELRRRYPDPLSRARPRPGPIPKSQSAR